ncbi:Aldehyde/histidinol dehydrogenase [Ampelomyces quisqualis]|uniref:aldehyde dehydrogenase (NAD(+)) n=1 Tax=Ampelomyces quisqualis TaxID=50730 RepID=A0A6A5QWU9_AMPQU|nr:Aldehyde/histidinol dehydrogenase [Ampelomyces quisqualis]
MDFVDFTISKVHKHQQVELVTYLGISKDAELLCIRPGEEPKNIIWGDATYSLAKTHPGWSALSLQQRGVPLKKIGELVMSREEELAQLDAIAMGRPHIRHTSLNTSGFLNMGLRQPFGVVAIVIPWNAPLIFFSEKVAPAVVAGNCVVVKSSEKAPLTSCQALSEHMKLRALSFTGSTRTGRAIQIASAKSNLKNVIFELGGKSPAIIFDDADVHLTAKETENSRIYVQDTIKDEFIEAFTKQAKSPTLGSSNNAATHHGPQADKTQHETVQRYIALAPPSQSLLIPSIIFTDVPRHSPLAKEEIFSPVVITNSFSFEFGLYAALYTKDLERAMRVARKLEPGMVGINCTSPAGICYLWGRRAVGRGVLDNWGY